jgi:CheY-like chemotaxis protein
MKILIVDDSTVQRMILTRILSGEGHSVIAAANGLAAVERLGEAPDVIVCDILMPGLDGYGLLGLLARRESAIPVVIASADIHASTQDKCRELGAAAFVAKPYSDDDLLAALTRAVQSRSADALVSASA